MEVYNISFLEWKEYDIRKPINITYTFTDLEKLKEYFIYLKNDIQSKCKASGIVKVAKNTIDGSDGKGRHFSVHITVSDIDGRSGMILSDSNTHGCDFSNDAIKEPSKGTPKVTWPGYGGGDEHA